MGLFDICLFNIKSSRIFLPFSIHIVISHARFSVACIVQKSILSSQRNELGRYIDVCLNLFSRFQFYLLVFRE